MVERKQRIGVVIKKIMSGGLLIVSTAYTTLQIQLKWDAVDTQSMQTYDLSNAAALIEKTTITANGA